MIRTALLLALACAGCQSRIEQQVAADAVARYEMAKRNGASAPEVCSYAMGVTAAFLQAKDEASYQKWLAVQKSDCTRAGMPQ